MSGTGAIGSFSIGVSPVGGVIIIPTIPPPSVGVVGGSVTLTTTSDPKVAFVARTNNMMNLSQLIDAVYIETNRPDLVQETLQAILEATLSIHTADVWYKDIREALIVFDMGGNYLQQLDTASIPFFKSMAYMRKTDPSVVIAEQAGLIPTMAPRSFSFLKNIDIGDILDSYAREKRDVWYQAGQTINIKSSTPLKYVTAGWYAYPNLDPTGILFSSWVAVELPYCIVYRAAAKIFAVIGEDRSFAMYMRQPTPRAGEETGGLYYQQMAQLRRTNISPQV